VIQFLIDENLSPRLTETVQAFGFVAYHVAHRGWSALKDPQVLRRILAEDLTIVTNNWDDFRPMLAREEVHPGVVVILPAVRRDGRRSCSAPRCTRSPITIHRSTWSTRCWRWTRTGP
jgi:hypothetical protein